MGLLLTNARQKAVVRLRQAGALARGKLQLAPEDIEARPDDDPDADPLAPLRKLYNADFIIGQGCPKIFLWDFSYC